jgi:hypothetical protein
MKATCVLVFSSLLVIPTISLAQTAPSRPPAVISTLSSGINLRSIAGAPFSADVIKESAQTLADGTKGTIQTSGKMFRDSAGRTRSETELKNATETRRYVTILDPVEQLNIRLDPQTKTAMLFPFPAGPTQKDQLKLKNALATRSTQASRQPALVASLELGASTVQGFAVTGTQRTVPAAANLPNAERARNVTVESWFSPELHIELQSKTIDPLLGGSTARLVNIAVAEPDRALFQIPSDYTIQNYSLRK